MTAIPDPSRPHDNLDQVKRQAKELLRDYRAGSPDAVALVAAYYRDADASSFALADAQLVTARAAGFESWPKLKAYLDAVTAARSSGGSDQVYAVPQFVSPPVDVDRARRDGVPTEVIELLRRHNAAQDRIRSAELTGTRARRHNPIDAGYGAPDEWEFGDSEGRANAAVTFDRASGKGRVDATEVDGATMVTHTGGHMSPADESLVLLMFRKFDPAAFAGIERVDGSLRVFRSKAGDEQLWFEASARLVRMQLQTSRGDVTLEIDHYSRVREDVDNGFEFPTRVTVTVQHEPPVSNDHRHDFRYKFHNLRFNFADGTKVTLDWPGVQETLDLTNEVPPGTGRVEIRRTIRNPGLTDFTLDFEYLAGESTWRFEPTRGRIVVSPGESALLKVDATFDPQRPAAPLPRVRGWFGEGEWRSEPVEMSLRPIVRRRAVAARVDRPPTPDGIIVPGEYGGEQPCKAFAELQSGSGPPFDTEFCVAYDDRAIYVAITAFEDRATSRHQAETRRDGDLRADDSVELFFDAVNARTNYRYFAVSAANVQFDALGGPDRGPFGDVTWDAEWSSAVKAYDDRVVYEIAIPYSALGVRPSRPGDAWGFNVCRNRRRNPAEAGSWRLWSQWTLTYSRQHKPQHFGELVFA